MNRAAAFTDAGTSIMKLRLLLIVVVLLPSIHSHQIQKRFLWRTLAKIAAPFIRRPKAPQQMYPQQQFIPYHAPPVFQVAPTVPHLIPPSSGQVYLPIPGQNNYPQNFPLPPQPPPIPVPPSSFGSSTQWKPMVTQSDGGPLFYAPGVQSVQPPQDVPSPTLPNVLPFFSSVFLSKSGIEVPDGFVKVSLPAKVLLSMLGLGLGLDEPSIYLAKTNIPPSKDFVLLDVNSETVETLTAIAQHSNRLAEMSSAVSDNLISSVKKAAPQLTENDTKFDLNDILGEQIPFFDQTEATETTAETTVETTTELIITKQPEPETTTIFDDLDQTEISPAPKLPSLFLARKNADVPSDYIRVLFPDDILRQLRRRITRRLLNTQGVKQHELTEAYLSPSTDDGIAPPLGLVPVKLSSEALQILHNYGKDAEITHNANKESPQLALPRSVLERLSNDSSQKVTLISGRNTIVKTGSADVFIAQSDQKPPDGYVSIPLTSEAIDELRKNFLETNIGPDDISRIPVRAYIAPADKKLPAGHVAVPLPESVLKSLKSNRRTSDSVPSTENTVPMPENAVFIAEPSSTLYLAQSRKKTPANFRKLKLPENVMNDFKQAIPIDKLAEAGTQAKDLTTAYLATNNAYVPPGFLSISVPDNLAKMLENFVETSDVIDIEAESMDTTGKENSDSRDLGGDERSQLSRKMVDAILEALKRTLGEIVNKSRGEGKNKKKKKGNKKENSRENARITSGDNGENDLEDDEDIDDYQPIYQMSPFFPSNVETYPYVNPYQYGGLWTYSDGNPNYGEYVIADGSAQDRNAYYYNDGSQTMQYEISPQTQYQVTNFEKRNGEIPKETEKN